MVEGFSLFFLTFSKLWKLWEYTPPGPDNERKGPVVGRLYCAISALGMTCRNETAAGGSAIGFGGALGLGHHPHVGQPIGEVNVGRAGR